MADEGKTPETPPPAPDLGKLVEAAVAKHGDQTSALKAFAADLYSARDDLKAARAKLPPDGARVLTGDDVKHWDAYTSLGKPSDLRKSLEEGSAATAKVTTYERERHHAEVAKVAGYNSSVLHRLATQDGIELAVIDVQGEGKKPSGVCAVVKGVDETGKPTQAPLADYAAKNWAEFLPALRGDPAAANPRQPGTPSRRDVSHRELSEQGQNPGRPSTYDRLIATGRYAKL